MDATDVYVIESDIQKSLEHTTVTRLCGVTQESWDYGGIFYSNCFRASKPITLTSLGFFGPACLPTTTSSSSSEGPVAYVVDIQIEQLKKACSSHTKSISLPVKVSRTETIFYVNFPTPLNILPGVWYKIKFRLNGPDTFRGIQPVDHVYSSDGITFDFFQGSLQMPQLKYIRRCM